MELGVSFYANFVLKKTGNMYNVHAIWLVFCGVAAVLQDCLDPPGNGLCQVPLIYIVSVKKGVRYKFTCPSLILKATPLGIVSLESPVSFGVADQKLAP